ncbi:general substrate transporter [Annulohypoxylon maeteangense]|uniref:general substrate transporter n=1 Tax=Annulohypoxylon maeteangense TaxID=1927788 RepID=UPI00200868B6|nr:general substrate transporter [Annulohypoxylon maeteangense]KAI0884275.1 general substrate transporter [Annulohypoxylon maeteangense]
MSDLDIDNKDDLKVGANIVGSSDHVEDVQFKNAEEFTELSGIEATAASKAAWLICIAVSLGGLLFGYDTGYISSVLVTIGTSLGHALDSSEQELVTSLTSGGALIGAVFAGLTADRYGRRMPIWIACIVFVIGTVLQTAAYHLPQFAVGRFVVGLGVGSAAMIVPLYIGELAPAKYRGRMIAFNNMSVTFGQLLASALGAGFAQVGGQAWRATVGIGAVPAIALAGLLFLCPESPRQLVAHGHSDEASKVLMRIYPTSTEEQRRAKIQSIEMSIQEATNTMVDDSIWRSLKRIFTTPATGRAVLTACVIMAISQLGGFNTLMYYSATLFSIVGFNNAAVVAITVSGTNFVFSFLNLVVVDRFGRRAILLITVLGMAICMLIASVSFHYIPIDKNLVVQSDNVGWPATVLLVTIICYVACFSTGVATIAWIGTELIPLEVRAVGTMLNTVTCWSTNIIIASTFLSMMKGITPSGAFGFYCGICTVGWIFIVFCFPEAKGMPLEAIREVFANGFGVKFSKQWQKENKEFAKLNTHQSFAH